MIRTFATLRLCLRFFCVSGAAQSRYEKQDKPTRDLSLTDSYLILVKCYRPHSRILFLLNTGGHFLQNVHFRLQFGVLRFGRSQLFVSGLECRDSLILLDFLLLQGFHLFSQFLGRTDDEAHRSSGCAIGFQKTDRDIER
jgi:hypothetical protein